MNITTQTEQIFTETTVAFGQSKDIGIYALASAVNSLAAAGAGHICAGVRIMAPEFIFKPNVYAMEKIIRSACRREQIELIEIKSEKNPALPQSMVIVTAVGQNMPEELHKTGNLCPGQDIVLTKWAGMEGMLRIVSEREAELKERFSPVFLKQIQSYKDYIFARKEIRAAEAAGAACIHQIGEGGIFAALWELAKEAGTGLEADMKRLSVLQETIEVCECYRLNPYQLTSTGSMLMVADNGKELIKQLRRQHIQAEVIGCFTYGNDKIIRNGEEIRYIDRPAPDELIKIFNGGLHGTD